MASASCLVVAALSLAQTSELEKPAELLLMASGRANLFDTALIDWSMWKDGSVTRYTSRYAGSEFLLVRHSPDGDSQSGEPATPFTYVDRYYLLDAEGNQWSHVEYDGLCHIRDSSTDPILAQPDVRTLGLTPNNVGYSVRRMLDPASYVDAAYHDGPPHSYARSANDDGTVEVVAEWTLGRSVRWVLDPARDCAPVFSEMTVISGDGSTRTAQAYLKHRKFQDHWFTEEIEFYRDGELWATVSVEHAEFDQPAHPRTLTAAAMLPMLPGTNVMRCRSGQWLEQVEIFDGHGIMSLSDYQRHLESGDLDNSDFVRRIRLNLTDPPGTFPKKCENLPMVVFPLEKLPGRWEVYTRVFIQTQRLSAAQTELAWTTLKKAQALADKHLKAHRQELDQIDKERISTRRSLMNGSSDEALVAEKMAALEKREKAIGDPVERIFHDVLKAGLEKLLTPTQRELMESRSTASSQSRAATEPGGGRP